MSFIAKRFLYDQVYDVPLSVGGAAFPPGFLYAPGIYSFSGVSFDMTQSGVYRFYDPLARINAWRSVTNTDPLEMCSVFAQLSCHGGEDNMQPITTLNQIARNRRARITCGVLSSWALSWLQRAGFEARIVRFLTMTPPNGYDEGHVAVEVKVNGHWVFADLDLGRYYSYAGTPLSARDFLSHVVPYDFDIKFLSLTGSKHDTSPQNANPFNYASLNELVFYNDFALKIWVQRICQAIGIDAPNGNTYWLLPAGSGARAAWVQSLSANWIVDPSPAVWNNRFY